MNALQEKIREVGRSLLPIVALVLILIYGLVPVDLPVLIRFIFGAFFLFVGLSIFLWGVDQSMNPIGYHMARQVATSKKLPAAILLTFLLGFLITVAEPDLLILGNQVEEASGGQIGARFMVMCVSVGVGVMIALGALRILFKKKVNILLGITYAVIFLIGLKVSEEFLGISFDASGATTGALTTPFILALSIGLSRMKGGDSSEEDSFGLVGIMSAGPILSVMLLSVITGQSHIQGEAEPFQVQAGGLLAPILDHIPATLLESLIALAPIAVLFFLFQIFKFKLKSREIFGIVRGLIYSLIGLTFFLVGANQGFMDMGRLLGMGIANSHPLLLPFIGLLMGLIVVLAEPAVHVLGEQIQEVSAGAIPVKLIRLTLSIGVGIAIALSMLRIMTPEIKLWYFLLPGFALAILLSFFTDPIFVGIAYDAGGVASGPMSATFVLAFAQGAAEVIPTANILVDAFGIIAMIAMTPVLSLMVLGAVFTAKRKRHAAEQEELEDKQLKVLPLERSSAPLHDMIYCVVDRGLADQVVALAREEGAYGATILHGRDARADLFSSYSLNLEPEKEVLLFIVRSTLSDRIVDRLLDEQLKRPKTRIHTVLVIPVEAAAGMSMTGSLASDDSPAGEGDSARDDGPANESSPASDDSSAGEGSSASNDGQVSNDKSSDALLSNKDTTDAVTSIKKG